MTIVPTPHTVTPNSYPQKPSLKSIRINNTLAGISNGLVNVTVAASLPNGTTSPPSNATVSLLAKFIEANKELAFYK
jgi:hypothetical protein